MKDFQQDFTITSDGVLTSNVFDISQEIGGFSHIDLVLNIPSYTSGQVSVTPEGSLDATNWIALASTPKKSATGLFDFILPRAYPYLRFKINSEDTAILILKLKASTSSAESKVDFYQKVKEGKILGYEFISVFGRVRDLLIATNERTVWEYGTPAPLGGNNEPLRPTDGTAPIDSISSSSASDTVDIEIIGLDIEGDEVKQIVTLAGQTKTAITIPLWRVNSMRVVSENTNPAIGDGLVGDVYLYDGTSAITLGVPNDPTKVAGFIRLNNGTTLVGQNRSLAAQFTVPKGKTAYMISNRFDVERSLTASMKFKLYIREFGKYYELIDSGSVETTGSSLHSHDDNVSGEIPEKSDIVVRAETFTDTTDGNAKFDLILKTN